jgi:hypothetical protein
MATQFLMEANKNAKGKKVNNTCNHVVCRGFIDKVAHAFALDSEDDSIDCSNADTGRKYPFEKSTRTLGAHNHSECIETQSSGFSFGNSNRSRAGR